MCCISKADILTTQLLDFEGELISFEGQLDKICHGINRRGDDYVVAGLHKDVAALRDRVTTIDRQYEQITSVTPANDCIARKFVQVAFKLTQYVLIIIAAVIMSKLDQITAYPSNQVYWCFTCFASFIASEVAYYGLMCYFLNSTERDVIEKAKVHGPFVSCALKICGILESLTTKKKAVEGGEVIKVKQREYHRFQQLKLELSHSVPKNTRAQQEEVLVEVVEDGDDGFSRVSSGERGYDGDVDLSVSDVQW